MKKLFGNWLPASGIAILSLASVPLLEAFALSAGILSAGRHLHEEVAESSISRRTSLPITNAGINRSSLEIKQINLNPNNIPEAIETGDYNIAQFGFGSQVAPANPPASINLSPSVESTTPLGQYPSPGAESGTPGPSVSAPAAQTVDLAPMNSESVDQSMDRACYQALSKKKCDDWCEGKSLMTMADSIILPSGSKQELCSPGLLPPRTKEEIEKSRSAYCKLYGNARWAAEMCGVASPSLPAPVALPRRVPSCNPAYGECPDQQNVQYWDRPQAPGRQIKQCWKYKGGC